MSLTKHARTRLQQRGIPNLFVDAILDFGTSVPNGDGSEIVFLGRRGREVAQASICHRCKAKTPYLVIGTSGQIITVGHLTRRINRK